MKKTKGFSLIELMVVILIGAIVLMIAISVGKQMRGRADLTSAANGFIADYSFARQLASRENRTVAIVFSDDGTSYRILQQRQDQLGIYPINEGTCETVKTVKPLDGKRFIYFPKDHSYQDMAVNSTGEIRKFPVDANDATAAVTLNFIKEIGVEGTDLVYLKKDIKISLTGGIRIVEKGASKL